VALLLPADVGFHNLAFSPFSPQPLTFITVSTRGVSGTRWMVESTSLFSLLFVKKYGNMNVR
jgi:hypothetical protein